MALAQETDVLLLDEPTTFLDVAHHDVLDLLADLNQRRATTVVAVLHDEPGRALPHRPWWSSRPWSPEATVGDVFGMRCTVIDDPVAGTPGQVGPAASEAVRRA